MNLALLGWLPVVWADGPPAAPPQVSVRAWIDGDVDAHGADVWVQVESPVDVSPQLVVPELPDTTLTPSGDPATEATSDRRITTFRFRFDAPQGRHAIGPFTAREPEGSPPFRADSTMVYVDVGVEPLDLGELADIAEPSPVWTFPLMAVVTLAGVAGLIGAAVVVGLRRQSPGPIAEVEAEPPDIVALRAWKAARHDPRLDDHERALALSRIFREYAEAALHFPAAKWTTTETLAHLGALPHLEAGNLPRARRLLRATDRVKYAEEAPGVDLFEELDADLRAFVSSTRPVRWTPT